MQNQVIECYHYFNMLIIVCFSVPIPHLLIMINFNNYTQNVQLIYLLNQNGYMHIMVIVEINKK